MSLIIALFLMFKIVTVLVPWPSALGNHSVLELLFHVYKTFRMEKMAITFLLTQSVLLHNVMALFALSVENEGIIKLCLPLVSSHGRFAKIIPFKPLQNSVAWSVKT